jgi:hypothetical protein
MPRRRTVRSSTSLTNVGHWAFLLGALIAIATAFFNLDSTVLISTLFVLGLIVGFLNVTVEETTPFLVATIALILAGVVNLRAIPAIGFVLSEILSNIVVFVVPAAVIVSLKSIYTLANQK